MHDGISIAKVVTKDVCTQARIYGKQEMKQYPTAGRPHPLRVLLTTLKVAQVLSGMKAAVTGNVSLLLLCAWPDLEFAHVIVRQAVPFPTGRRVEAAVAGIILVHALTSIHLAPIETCKLRVHLQQRRRQDRVELRLLSHRHGSHEALLTLQLVLSLLLEPVLLPLRRFLVEQWLDTYPAGFGAEVPSKCIRSCKSATAAPCLCRLERASTDEFLLARMQSFMTFPIVLSREGFATDCTYEWPLVGMRP